ncbi:MAG: aminopeptidase, partial [Acidobacteriaceae bacterium]|nr:aminopeptidase [Acidobacteriaceae bacterium]
MSTDLKSIDFDPELREGAHNAVYVCLKVQPSEKVTVITDQASEEIAASLVAELEDCDCTYNTFVLEDLAPRPLVNMPEVVLNDLTTSQVSIFAVQAQANELRTRMQMCDVVNRHRLRHAHMVNIEKKIMLEGMRADFQQVDELTRRVMEIANKARCIRAITPAGTDIRADLTPNYKWIKTSGLISCEKWGNLPGGETFTSPLEVNGTYVVDGVVGDYLCAKYGDLKETPLTLEVEANRLVKASSVNKALEREFWEYTHRDENSDRVGEFAIGTNLAIHEIVGNILQDEKIPGIHMAFG